MAPQVSVSVIICAHALDRSDMLRGALRSLADQTSAATEIIVVCDHNLQLSDWVRTEAPSVVVVDHRGEKGLSGARNTGVAEAGADVVAFLDDDAEAAPDWLARMREHYRDPDVIAVGGKAVAVWPTIRPRWFPEEFEWVVGCTHRGLPEHIGEVRNLVGCNMSFRRSAFEVAGTFRGGLGRNGNNASGCEETEFFIRVRQAMPEKRILYDPRIVVRHHVSEDRVCWRYFRERCRAEGRSKAAVVRLAGRREGLSSERRYTRAVLPLGLLRGVRSGLAGDLSGFRRAGAIVGGFAYVVGSYFGARLSAGKPRDRRSPFLPRRVVDIDLDRPLGDLPCVDPASGERLEATFCLVRADSRPVRWVEVSHADGDIPVARLRALLTRDGITAESVTGEDQGGASAGTATPTEWPLVTAVIATRDRPESLARVLETLLAQDYANFEVVVVDSAPSSRATEDLVAGYCDAKAKIRYIRENRPGLGRAHNRGMLEARGAVLAFTDDDVLVDRGWISAIAANFSAMANLGCVTGLILPAELQTRAQFWTERHGGFGKGLSRRVFDLGSHRPADPLFPFAAGALGSGANMAFSREALQYIGGFDPALGAGTLARGGDDLAAFVAVINEGFRLVYEPRSIVWHFHRRAEAGMRRQAFGYGVGLGAYLTKLVIEQPSLLPHFLRAFPAAAAHLFGPGSQKNQRLPRDYPRSLVWRERLGIVAGAPAYIGSRLMAGRERRVLGGPAAVPALSDT